MRKYTYACIQQRLVTRNNGYQGTRTSNSPKLNCLNKKLAGKQPSRTSRITNENQHSSTVLNEPRQYLIMQINTSLNLDLGFDLNSARQGSRKFQYVRVCSSMFEYVRACSGRCRECLVGIVFNVAST